MNILWQKYRISEDGGGRFWHSTTMQNSNMDMKTGFEGASTQEMPPTLTLRPPAHRHYHNTQIPLLIRHCMCLYASSRSIDQNSILFTWERQCQRTLCRLYHSDEELLAGIGSWRCLATAIHSQYRGESLLTVRDIGEWLLAQYQRLPRRHMWSLLASQDHMTPSKFFHAWIRRKKEGRFE